MKWIIVVFTFLLVFSSPFALNSQIIDSDYVREGQSEEQGKVLGVEQETEEENIEQDVQEESFLDSDLVDALAIMGGVILVALLAYTVYESKRKSN